MLIRRAGSILSGVLLLAVAGAASHAQDKTLTVRSIADAPSFAKRALVIGIGQYEHANSLSPETYNDARLFARMLQDQFRFPDDAITLITDAPGTPEKELPTYVHLRSVFNTLINSLTDRSEVIVYFSGHGIRANDRDWLVPLDGDPEDVPSTCVNYDDIKSRLNTKKPARALLIVDACRNLAGGKHAGSSGFGAGAGLSGPQFAELLSCQPQETSQIGLSTDFAESVFTHFLLAGFTGDPEAQENGVVTFDSLKAYVQGRVSQYVSKHYGSTQLPDGRASLGRMVLVRPPQANPPKRADVERPHLNTGPRHREVPGATNTNAKEGAKKVPVPPLRFEEAHTYKVSFAGDSIMVADLDGDGNPDVVIGGSTEVPGNEIGILYGRPDGTLEPYVTLLTWLAGIGSRQLVDLNGDGRSDLVFLDGLGKLVILYSKENRKYADPVFQSLDCTGALYVGDFNQDGHPDIAVTSSGNGGPVVIKVLLNNGTGTFKEHSQINQGGYVDALTAHDLNGDGIPDLVVSVENGNRSGVGVYLGDGKGGFREGSTYDVGTLNMSRPTVADLNGDGKPDILVCYCQGASVVVLLNKGNGAFDAPTRYPAHGFPITVHVADFSGDGKPDFAVANAGTSTVSVYRNRGNGIYEDPIVLEVGGGNCRSASVADFNHDGKPDIVTQNVSNSTIGILINRTGAK